MSRLVTSRSARSDLVAAAMKGKIAAIARLLSRAEVGGPAAMADLEAVYAHTGVAHVVGITGVPGSGKSTLVAQLTRCFRAAGRRIGIVAVDPTSPFSGGSILGDRIRMNDLGEDPGVFIRSMATRGAMGGLAAATLDAVDVLDAAGYDLIFIETVGVGQDEVDVVQAAHTTVVVSAPGLGDDIQAIKAGILEIADVHAVSKCDRQDAHRTIADLENMLAAATNSRAPDWQLPVVATSANTGEGVELLCEKIDAHHSFLRDSGDLRRRQRNIGERRVLAAAENMVREQFQHQRLADFEDLMAGVTKRTMHPFTAAKTLLARMNGESRET